MRVKVSASRRRDDRRLLSIEQGFDCSQGGGAVGDDPIEGVEVDALNLTVKSKQRGGMLLAAAKVVDD